MTCFCHKLRTGQFDILTENEVSLIEDYIALSMLDYLLIHKAMVLTKVWKQAPHLFQSASTVVRPQTTSAVVGVKRRSLCTDSLPEQRPKHKLSYSSRLQKTYSAEGIPTRQTTVLGLQKESVYLRLFRAIEKSEDFRRFCAYTFAQLHIKGTSIDPILDEIQHATSATPKDTRDKVYKILQRGERWAEIVVVFASISQRKPEEVVGLLCLLGAPSS